MYLNSVHTGASLNPETCLLITFDVFKCKYYNHCHYYSYCLLITFDVFKSDLEEKNKMDEMRLLITFDVFK